MSLKQDLFTYASRMIRRPHSNVKEHETKKNRDVGLEMIGMIYIQMDDSIEFSTFLVHYAQLLPFLCSLICLFTRR